ncbi:DUF1998 domain-containing protein [Glutamicibacter arilaitensis]|uniref:DUF1998 domain-containing protein n=1 Tax=Glutamicibacter arilaitensis TaxID=256701 RepID=A0A4Y8TW81_9MICC|nr:DUF1998 domain-containing protein [Glutamicibacter arilaitensis]TFH55932.1 DUF1998 domain-containing protein [Glutamicibacter arilaitensis]
MSKTYEARRSQLISTFGVGSLFPAENHSFMVTSIDQWKREWLKPVSEPRLARSLGVSTLMLPPSGEKRNIPVIRFPNVLICPGCNRLGTLRTLKANYQDPVCVHCSKPGQLTPSRFIVACQNGHIDDFPYSYWVHGYTEKDSENHQLSLVSEGRTSSLADITIKCSCGKRRSMADAFNPMMLREMRCSGTRPWLGYGYFEKGCDKAPKTVQRGASNVWFPAVRSAISIPPYSEFISRLVTQNQHLFENPQVLQPQGQFVLESFQQRFAGRFTVDELKSEITRQFHYGDDVLLTEDDLREQEFDALITGRADESDTDFVAEKRQVPPTQGHWISNVRKVTRLREVRALHGFSRLFPIEQGGETALSSLLPEDNPQSWLPAIETLGEGIFISIDRSLINQWAQTDFAQNRLNILQSNAEKASKQRKVEAHTVEIATVLLHTLSHLLIDQLALDAGYPASSIRERLFTGSNQAGILLYTATADSAGSLGGIAALAEPGSLEPALQEVLERLSWCSADPVCIESKGAGTDGLNLAACHCCVLVPETSCERFNVDLDRALVFGTPESHDDQGFIAWASNAYQYGKASENSSSQINENVVPEFLFGTIWEQIAVNEPALAPTVIALAKANIPNADWGTEIGPEFEWQADIAWESHRVAIVLDKNSDRDDWLRKKNWDVFHIADMSPSDLANKISEIVY